MIDDYSHNDIDVIYISENIPGPTEQCLEFEELYRNFNSQLMHNCECDERCLPERCKCLQISGGFNYTLLGQQKNNSVYVINKKNCSSINSYPFVECNELCRCSNSCGNRLVQKGPVETLYLKPSQNKLKGWGLFTNSLIPKGAFVCEYAGEVLTKSQALFRHNFNKKHKKMNYIFCLNEHVDGKILQTYIDPSSFGNIGRYINHSCDPTCEIVPVRVNCPIPKLAVFSLFDIVPGTEITFDYGSDAKIYIDEGERTLCLCDSSKCKGFLPYLPF